MNAQRVGAILPSPHPQVHTTAEVTPRDTVGLNRVECEICRWIGVTLAMTRRFGRATPGQRVVDSVPGNYGTTQTMLAVMGLDGLDARWGTVSASEGNRARGESLTH